MAAFRASLLTLGLALASPQSPGGSERIGKSPQALAVNTPAVNTPAVNTPAVNTPAVNTPAANTPPANTPPANTPPANTPAADTPAADTPAEDTASNEAPLVAYALELGLPEKDDTLEKARQVRAAAHELERNPPPPGAECAKTLGAGRFASQYQALAYVQFEAGDFEAAIDSYRSALECRPRAPAVYAGISSAWLALGRTEEARAALDQAIAVDADNRGLLEARARLDFLDGRWADALAQFRLSTLEEHRTEFSNYAESLFWLTQRRAGVREPEVLPHDPQEDDWPLPILETLLGRKTEKELVEEIREQRAEQRVREWLTEALYYVGERYQADGDIETARRHFAAVVNLKQLNYVEYGMARAQLARMREQEKQ